MSDAGFSVRVSGHTISLSGRLDFTTAAEALKSVTGLLNNAGAEHSGSGDNTMTIDMSGISSANSAGLAVMIEWLAVVQRSDQKITFENIPDSLHQISTVCQVDSLI